MSVTPQVGRTGKITPVAELEPTALSGATIVRATGHHYGLVKEQGLGRDSIIELTRSGLVIPKINKVLKPSTVQIPEKCPSCGEQLVWESDFLMCLNHQHCPAQIIGKMEYFFKILANNDGFGIATIEKLYQHGIRKISQIYNLSLDDLIAIGFGEKTSTNLINQLDRSKSEQIEDWRFLAAFGVERMGLGNCENLLRAYPLAQIFKLSVSQIAAIEGFAQLSAELMVTGLSRIAQEFEKLYAEGFNLDFTPIGADIEVEHPLVGKKLVFTGKMQGSREAMKKQAKTLGIEVASSVSGKTDYLVIGENVGQKKLQSAADNQVEIITEAQYLDLISH